MKTLPMPPLYDEEKRIAGLLGADVGPWDKWRCINGWQREIHRLKAYPIGGLPCTDRGREAMEIVAERLKKAYDALKAWQEYDEDVAR